jgi:AraC-like DNA-binding protein
LEFAFDLSPIAPHERFEFWHDVGSLVHRPVRSGYTAPASQLRVRAKMRITGEAILGRMNASAQHFERTERMIQTDFFDSFLLVLLERGSVNWTAQSNQYNAQAGDLLLLDNQEIGQSKWTDHQQTYASLPRGVLANHGWQQPAQRILRSGNPSAEILKQYLQTLWNSHPAGSPGTTDKLIQGLASLTRIYFSETGLLHDAEAETHKEPIQDSIKRWIEGQLHNPDLSSAQICAAFYLSRSTLYELFKPEGGIRSYLQKRRLEQARLILENPAHQVGVSEIAQRLGFRSLSSFSRSFRDHWGLSAREIRKQAIAESKAISQEQVQSLDPRPDQSQLKENAGDYYKAIKAMSSKQPQLRQYSMDY